MDGALKKVDVEIEQSVAEKLRAMSEYTKLTSAEIVNTALKRFIATHKDFFPPVKK